MVAKLGEMLVNSKLIRPEQLERALEYQKIYGGKIGEVLIKLGFIEEGLLTSFLATQHQVELIDVESLIIPKSLMKHIPLNLLKKHVLLPVSLRNGTLTIVTSDPTDYQAIEEIQLATNYRIEVAVAKRSAIIMALRTYEEESLGVPSRIGETAITSSSSVLGEDAEKKSPSPDLMLKSLVALLIAKGFISKDEFTDIVHKIELYDQLL